MAGSVPEITTGSIVAMSGLDKRPVFFLTLRGSQKPNLVVKGEATAKLAQMSDADVQTSVKWGSKMMKNVNNAQVNTKIMTQAEIAVFKAAARQFLAAGSPQLGNVTGSEPYNWVKMPMVEDLTDAEFFAKGSADADMAKVKDNINRFSEPRFWYDLGKVLAVDVFNGNSDRFNITTGAWSNYGNVLFLDKGKTAVIGLDTFDPNAKAKANLNRGGHFDELKILIDPGRRQQFAKACARSVGQEMKDRLARKFADNKTTYFIIELPGLFDQKDMLKVEVARMHHLFDKYAVHLEKGIADGAAELKTYLEKKVNPPKPAAWVAAAPQKQALPAFPSAGKLKLPPPPPPLVRTGLPPPPPPLVQPPPPPQGKQIPQGIIDRMKFLGWKT